MELYRAIALILGAMGALLVFSLFTFLAIWLVMLGLFLFSRVSKCVGFFVDWSWLQFLATIACGVGIPYIILILTAGF